MKRAPATLRAAIILPAMLATAALSGCVAAAPVAAGLGMGAVSKSMVKSQTDEIYSQGYGPEMENGLRIGKQRHPEVFGSMTVDDPEYVCLFRSEIQTYVAWADDIGVTAAANKAIDNAAERSRKGECGDADRMLNLINPFGTI